MSLFRLITRYKFFPVCAFGLIFLCATSSSSATDAVTLDELLDRVKQGSISEAQEQKEREVRFLKEKHKQLQLLDEAKKLRQQEETRSSELEKLYDTHDALLKKQQQLLTERLGVLKELFGTVQAATGDLKANMETSLVSAQFPGRIEFLENLIKKMSNKTQLASVEELEQLWFLLQQEMIESGRIVEFSSEVVGINGSRKQQDVVRVGVFNIISQGNYLQYDNSTGDLLVLPRQPAHRFTDSAATLQKASSGFTQFGVDPTGPGGGTLLAALIDLPNISERIQQGRVVGYIIIALGFTAFFIALWRLMILKKLSMRISAQLKTPSMPNLDNPLGRVLSVGQNYKGINTEAFELKLHEAVLRETPHLEKWINFIKITAMVAPLLGLLGTVTGMILTFQTLTIFGANEPQAMAGGISSALVTTVLGLCVAIPMLFLHSLVHGSCKRIIHILEEQTAGIIAEQAESQS